MSEQRNLYRGSPLRPWLRLTLVAADGATREIDVVADTGNPCALIVDQDVLDRFNLGLLPGMNTNFGPLQGGWLRIQIVDLGFDEDVLCYGSDTVAQAARDSDPDLVGVAGLPLLSMMEYGGDGHSFWIRR